MTQHNVEDLIRKRVRDPIRRNQSDLYRRTGAGYKPTPQARALTQIRHGDDEHVMVDINVLKARKICLPSILAQHDNVIEIPERYQAEQIQVLDDINYDLKLMRNYISGQERQFAQLREREKRNSE